MSPNTQYYIRAYATNSAGTAYGNELSFTTQTNIYIAMYPTGTVFCNNIVTAVVDVTNPLTGKTWMDRNLGASQVATSSTDAAAYGDLYQWGRRADGHQCRTSPTTATLSSTDQTNHGSFIISNNSPFDWRNPINSNLWQGVNGINNPCPIGYRLPSDNELNIELLSWDSNNSLGAFNSILKLPKGGTRFYLGTVELVGQFGEYWSSTINTNNSNQLRFDNDNPAGIITNLRGIGNSVRCIKN